MCATTSTYRAACPVGSYAGSNSTTATRYLNHTQNASPSEELYIRGVNSNAESYFSRGPEMNMSMTSYNLSTAQISFSKPFIYAPPKDMFPSQIENENFGYVPQTLIDWMAQDLNYVSIFPGIASCLPGGPSMDFHSYFCPSKRPRIPPANRLGFLISQSHLTVSSIITIAGKGCFHPGECSTPAAPGATPVAATPVVTPEAHLQDGMFKSIFQYKSFIVTESLSKHLRGLSLQSPNLPKV